jgi:protein O-mannosyl-transferase
VGAALLLRRAAPRRWALSLSAAGAVAGLLLAGATLWRNKVWWSDVALWTDAAGKSPGKSRPQLNLGTALAEAGRPGAALGPLGEAVRLDPRSSWARAQLGAVLVSLGRIGEGEAELREALRLKPDDPEALFNLAVVLQRTARAEEARGLFRRFLEVAPPGYGAARRFAAERVAR